MRLCLVGSWSDSIFDFYKVIFYPGFNFFLAFTNFNCANIIYDKKATAVHMLSFNKHLFSTGLCMKDTVVLCMGLPGNQSSQYYGLLVGTLKYSRLLWIWMIQVNPIQFNMPIYENNLSCFFSFLLNCYSLHFASFSPFLMSKYKFSVLCWLSVSFTYAF